jgi:alanine or glycine:cation symporter, AGCS family
MRSTLVRAFLLAGLFTSLAAAAAWALQDSPAKTEATPAKTEEVKTEEQSSGQEADGNEADEEQKPEKLSLMARAEKRIDDFAGQCVGAIASVFFYEIGSSTFSKSLDGSVTDVEEIRKLIDDAEAAGFNPGEVDYSLSLPPRALTVRQADALQKTLIQEFTAGRTMTFKVAVRDSGDDGKTHFKAVSHGVPVVVLWLALGAVFFTLRMGFINIRGFKHAIQVTAGKFDNPKDKGEVSHFQALTAALSATVGLGNIAGVAIAIMAGGPGATFWMIIAGLLGMSSKFTECALGQKYREVRSDGRIMGGAMFYLSKGLGEMKMAVFGKALAVLFAVLCVFASFGGGNAFQVNQSGNAIRSQIQKQDNDQLRKLDAEIAQAEERNAPAEVARLKGERDELNRKVLRTGAAFNWGYGLLMAVLVGIVIIGGIRRIAATAEKIVPLMCGVYILACLWILLSDFTAIPGAISLIVGEAFTPQAGYGGFLGVLIMGFRRAAFSNEAGVGSAAIAHSAAKTDYPVREGIVALLEPFIDTVVVCTMTALVIVITGAYADPKYAHYVASNNGAALTSEAMKDRIWWFPYILSGAVVLFAYSTMISWSYYGERCWAYLFGDRASMAYRVVFLVFVVLGSVVSATNVLDLSDLAILGMAFPNILGVVLLSGLVKKDLDVYWAKLKAGELDVKKK